MNYEEAFELAQTIAKAHPAFKAEIWPQVSATLGDAPEHAVTVTVTYSPGFKAMFTCTAGEYNRRTGKTPRE